MYNRIILTAGVSIIGNVRRRLEKKKDRTSEEEVTLQVLKNLRPATKVCEKERDSIRKETILHLKQFVRNHEDIISHLSAEISIIDLLIKARRMEESSPAIIFYTDTFEGGISAKIVKWILEDYYKIHVSLHKLKEIDIHDRKTLNKALGNYLSQLSEVLATWDPSYTCFAPIGGYKILTSLGHLVGSLNNYSTVYLYEGSKVFHEIPSVKISFDENIIIENQLFFKRLLDMDWINLDELNYHEKQVMKEQSTLFEILEDKEEAFLVLSPFGQYLCRQPKYRSLFAAKVYLERGMKAFIERQHSSNWAHLLRNIYHLIEAREGKVDQSEGRAILYHEADFKQLNGVKTSYHLFKGESKPIVIRLIWKYVGEENAYYIAHVWFDHNRYERQAVSTLQAVEKSTEWEDISADFYQELAN